MAKNLPYSTKYHGMNWLGHPTFRGIHNQYRVIVYYVPWAYGQMYRSGHGLRNLGDRTVLASSRLARLAYIEKLAVSTYYGHVLPRGLALHDTLLFCVEKASEELGSELGLVRVCRYLQLAAQGLSCQEISRQLGLSREHVSRSYRKKAIRLLTHQFLSTITNGQ